MLLMVSLYVTTYLVFKHNPKMDPSIMGAINGCVHSWMEPMAKKAMTALKEHFPGRTLVHNDESS